MSKLIKGAFFLSGSPPGFTARSASWLFVLLLLAALPVAKTAIGAEQTGPGQEELQAQDEQQEQARLSRELGVRQLAIEELQFERGIYDPALMEAYSDLGGLYTELEDYASAAQLYADALQLTRINTGLYSEQQLPLIKSLIETNTRLKDWDKVDGLQHLNLHISSRLWGIGDAEYLLVAQDYGDWKLRLVRENLLQLNSRGLLGIAEDLSRFYQQTLFALDSQQEIDANNLLHILFSKSQADLTLARAVARMPATAFQGTATRYINQTRCQNVTDAAGSVVRQCYSVQVENPRYRQSQRDAKQYAVSRHTREIDRSLERMRFIRDSDGNLSSGQREQLDGQIATLETETLQLNRGYRQTSPF
jgi:hypothetical protein